jgi:hypothetical protein|tara:strand:- start:50 stop:667 length:618 start_codon:yes stop_codon:yes gene_type:complete
MSFRLRNKNVPTGLNDSATSGLKFTENDPNEKGEWTYIGGDKDTANRRERNNWKETDVTDQSVWDSNKNNVQGTYANFDEYVTAAQEYRDQSKEVQDRSDFSNTVHWSTKVDSKYKNHGGSMLAFLKRKVRSNFADAVRAKTWREDFDGRNSPKQQAWFEEAFNSSTSEKEFIKWAKKNAPYILERGRGRRNSHSRTTSGKTNWQ